jgi:hypothetical protein
MLGFQACHFGRRFIAEQSRTRSMSRAGAPASTAFTKTCLSSVPGSSSGFEPRPIAASTASFAKGFKICGSSSLSLTVMSAKSRISPAIPEKEQIHQDNYRTFWTPGKTPLPACQSVIFELRPTSTKDMNPWFANANRLSKAPANRCHCSSSPSPPASTYSTPQGLGRGLFRQGHYLQPD